MAIGNGAKYRVGGVDDTLFGDISGMCRDGDWAEWWLVGGKVVTSQIC